MPPPIDFFDPTYLEQVYAALFALLQNATFATGIKFATAERISEPPDEVPPASQPALRQIQGPAHAEQREVFGPTKWIFTAVAVIYLRANAPVTPQAPLPSTTANYIIWGISNAFNTQPPYQKQTLGGLVYHAWIEGDIIPEVTNEQMVITIPIQILPGPSG